VAVVLLLLKLKRPTWPAFVSVRRHTFGLYLSHTLVLSFVTGFVRRAMAHFGTPHFRYSRIGAVAVWAAALAVTYSVALLITKAVDAYPRLQWAIGSGSKKQIGLRSVRTTNAGKLQPVLKRTEASI
jgi:peptidoglycan/LPS O-acetylase OafA/YrhL